MPDLKLTLTDEQAAAALAQLQTPPPVPDPPPTPVPDPPPVPTPEPSTGPQGDKPTDETTGPRVPLTDVTVPTAGLTLPPGTYQGKRFKGIVTARPDTHFVDCELWGLKTQTVPPVTADHCDILGWFAVQTSNPDPDVQVFTASFCKIVGAKDNDVMHVGSYVWGAGAPYVNSLFEDCLIVSPFTGKTGAHFDLIQFSGGQGTVVFRRTALLYTNPLFVENEANNYINNGTKNQGVVFEDLWVEGGPVAYVLSGPMQITRATIARSAKHYGYVSGSTVATRPTLVDVYDDTGAPITS